MVDSLSVLLVSEDRSDDAIPVLKALIRKNDIFSRWKI